MDTCTTFAPTQSLNNKRGAFVEVGSTGRPKGIDLATHGKLVTVIEAKILLNGNQLVFSISAESLEERCLAFRAHFTGGSQGIFVATPDSGP